MTPEQEKRMKKAVERFKRDVWANLSSYKDNNLPVNAFAEKLEDAIVPFEKGYQVGINTHTKQAKPLVDALEFYAKKEHYDCASNHDYSEITYDMGDEATDALAKYRDDK